MIRERSKLVVWREARVDVGAVGKVKEHREETVVAARLVEEGGAAAGVDVGRHKAPLDVLGADPRHALVVRRVCGRLPRAVRDARLVHLVDALVAEPCDQLSFPSRCVSAVPSREERKGTQTKKTSGSIESSLTERTFENDTPSERWIPEQLMQQSRPRLIEIQSGSGRHVHRAAEGEKQADEKENGSEQTGSPAVAAALVVGVEVPEDLEHGRRVLLVDVGGVGPGGERREGRGRRLAEALLARVVDDGEPLRVLRGALGLEQEAPLGRDELEAVAAVEVVARAHRREHDVERGLGHHRARSRP